jgi:F-type H+-transporting ATPase subunit epsilon
VSTLEVTFVASDRTVWSGKAARVVVPAADGSMGILPRMQPTLAILDAGTVRITGEDGEVTERSVAGGFVSMDHNELTIAVDHADRAGSAR